MMLSSTIRTLIGGTAPFNIPAGREGWSPLLAFFLLFLGLFVGRGLLTLGGGVATLWIWLASSTCDCAAGGVGRGGAIGGGPAVGMGLSEAGERGMGLRRVVRVG